MYVEQLFSSQITYSKGQNVHKNIDNKYNFFVLNIVKQVLSKEQ